MWTKRIANLCPAQPKPHLRKGAVVTPELQEEIIAHLREFLGLDGEITGASKLVDHLGLDSIDLVETVQELERRYTISISDKEGQSLRTIGDAARIVAQHLGDAIDSPVGGKSVRSI